MYESQLMNIDLTKSTTSTYKILGDKLMVEMITLRYFEYSFAQIQCQIEINDFKVMKSSDIF